LAAVVAASCRHFHYNYIKFIETEGKMPSGQPAGSWRYIVIAFSDSLFDWIVRKSTLLTKEGGSRFG
jgi:hypothetical protein